jgi:hypothetical protein
VTPVKKNKKQKRHMFVYVHAWMIEKKVSAIGHITVTVRSPIDTGLSIVPSELFHYATMYLIECPSKKESCMLMITFERLKLVGIRQSSNRMIPTEFEYSIILSLTGCTVWAWIVWEKRVSGT